MSRQGMTGTGKRGMKGMSERGMTGPGKQGMTSTSKQGMTGTGKRGMTDPSKREGTGPRVILPGEGESFDFGGLGVDWKIDASEAQARFSVVHHPIAPRALASPLHYHHNEDEYSYVLEGTLGALLGEEVVTAGPGSWVFKPRHQWHAFWNAGDTPCQIIEVISPGGFEEYFREVAAAWGDLEAFARINQKYSLEMDFDSIPRLCQRFGLTFPEL